MRFSSLVRGHRGISRHLRAQALVKLRSTARLCFRSELLRLAIVSLSSWQVLFASMQARGGRGMRGSGGSIDHCSTPFCFRLGTSPLLPLPASSAGAPLKRERVPSYQLSVSKPQVALAYIGWGLGSCPGSESSESQRSL